MRILLTLLLAVSCYGATTTPAGVLTCNQNQSICSQAFTYSGASQLATFYGLGSSLQSVPGQNFAHMKVINNTAFPISLLTSPLSTPSEFTNMDVYVVSSGYGTWDNLPVFNNLYIQSLGNTGAQWTGGNGGSVPAGNIYVELWGGAGLRP